MLSEDCFTNIHIIFIVNPILFFKNYLAAVRVTKTVNSITKKHVHKGVAEIVLLVNFAFRNSSLNLKMESV